MNFFETELKKMTAKVTLMKNPKLVGRACIARLTDKVTVKVNFTTIREADFYPAILVTLLNRIEGKIDSLMIRFNEVWNYNGVLEAWTYKSETKWNRYQPTASDYNKIAKAINDYLENFAD